MPDAPPGGGPSTADPVEAFRALWADGGRPDVTAFLADRPGLQPHIVVDILRLDQQERWRRGEEVPAEWYLEEFPQIAADEEGAMVLVYGEVLARTERGERPALPDFILRFPQFADFLTAQWEVHEALEGMATHHPDGPTLTFDGPPPGPPAPPPLAVPGYEVEAEVGRGAVGVVYKARQAAVNRPCALKVILEGDRLAHPTRVIRFMEEGRAIARLRHPNIVGIYDMGTHEQGPFMALEWVGGGSLADRIGKAGVDPAEAARLTATVARAVGHAHDHGVVHRDLKPANVLMTEAGEPKVADFGLAKHVQEAHPAGVTATGQPVGTPTYMAPEQTGGVKAEVTPAADVYSLGAILYELLTGRPPLVGSSVQDTLRLVAEQDPVPPRELNARVPRDLQTVCLKCLEKDPKKRYPNGHALADDLDRFLVGEPIAARPAGPTERAARWLARNPWWAAAAAVLAGLVLTVVLVMVGGLVRLEAERRRAELAERQATDRFNHEQQALAAARAKEWRGLLAEARAIRLSGREDRPRGRALQKVSEARAVLDEAAGGKPSAADVALIRDEAIACLALPEVELLGPADGDSTVVLLHREGPAGAPLKPAAVAADGRLGVTIADPDWLRVWDLRSGRPILTTPGRLAPGHPFEPDGRVLRYLAGDRPARLRVTLPSAYRVEARGADRPPSREPVFGPGRKLLAEADGLGLVRLRNGQTGEVVARLEAPEWTRLVPRAFGPDGTELTADGVDTRTTHVWNIPALRAELRPLGLDWDGP